MFSGHFLAAFKIRFSGEPQDDTESTSPDQVLRLVFALGRLGFTLVLLGSSLLGPGFSFWSLGFTLAGLPPEEIAPKQRSLVFIIKYCPIKLHSCRTISPTLRVKCWSPVLEPWDGFFSSKPERALNFQWLSFAVSKPWLCFNLGGLFWETTCEKSFQKQALNHKDVGKQHKKSQKSDNQKNFEIIRIAE